MFVWKMQVQFLSHTAYILQIGQAAKSSGSCPVRNGFDSHICNHSQVHSQMCYGTLTYIQRVQCNGNTLALGASIGVRLPRFLPSGRLTHTAVSIVLKTIGTASNRMGVGTSVCRHKVTFTARVHPSSWLYRLFIYLAQQFSSVECQPVTLEVGGSSPLQVANSVSNRVQVYGGAW